MSDHEEPSSSLMSKNNMRRTYFVVAYSFLEKEIAKTFDMASSNTKTDYWTCALEPHIGGEHYHVSIKLSGAKKDGSVLKITFILNIKYLSIFLTSMIITRQLLNSLVRVMTMFTLVKVIQI